MRMLGATGTAPYLFEAIGKVPERCRRGLAWNYHQVDVAKRSGVLPHVGANQSFPAVSNHGPSNAAAYDEAQAGAFAVFALEYGKVEALRPVKLA